MGLPLSAPVEPLPSCQDGFEWESGIIKLLLTIGLYNYLQVHMIKLYNKLQMLPVQNDKKGLIKCRINLLH